MRSHTVSAVPFGELAAQGQRIFLEYRAGRAPRLARAGVDGVAVLVTRKDLRVAFVQPQRRGRRRGGQVDRDAGIAEFVDDAVEPAEIPTILGGLDAIPAEDGEGHGVDAGLLHQADVVVPDVLGPLVGIVVATEGDAAAIRGQQFRPFEVASHALLFSLRDFLFTEGIVQSFFDCACGEAGLPVLLQAQERDHQRDDRDQRARDHQVLDRLPASGGRLVLPLVQTDRERIPVRVLEHDQRQEVVVPRRHDREQGRGHDARREQWQRHLEERAQLARAVHASGLEQLGRHGLLREDPHQVQAERGHQGRDDHGPRRVRQVQLREQEELRDRQRDARHADRADDDHEHGFAARETELREPVAAQDREQGRAARAHDHVQDGVQQPTAEDAAVIGEHGLDVVPQANVRPKPRPNVEVKSAWVLVALTAR